MKWNPIKYSRCETTTTTDDIPCVKKRKLWCKSRSKRYTDRYRGFQRSRRMSQKFPEDTRSYSHSSNNRCSGRDHWLVRTGRGASPCNRTWCLLWACPCGRGPRAGQWRLGTWGLWWRWCFVRSEWSPAARTRERMSGRGVRKDLQGGTSPMDPVLRKS